jgi:hypothetical protein
MHNITQLLVLLELISVNVKHRDYDTDATPLLRISRVCSAFRISLTKSDTLIRRSQTIRKIIEFRIRTWDLTRPNSLEFLVRRRIIVLREIESLLVLYLKFLHLTTKGAVKRAEII